MNEDEYLQKRLDDQIAWYSTRSRANKRAFMTLRTVEIVAAALIPLLSGYVKQLSALQIVSGTLGLVVAVIAGLLGLFQFQENWVTYRSTTEALKHEKFLYLTRAEPYDTDEPFRRLVQRVEGLISKEQAAWVQYGKGKPAPTAQGGNTR
jgi:hypothetical protein